MTKKAPITPTPPPSNSATSLKMVAIEAGVSSSTVSRFLNGTAKVNGPKRVAIEAAIRKLKFVPDPMASGLAGGKSRCVGVITQALNSPFYGQGLLGIEDVLLASNYAPLFMSGHWREDDERRCIASLQGRRVDGIIILTPCLPDAALLEQVERTPIVVTGRALSAPRLVSLDFDNFSGARMATEHLISLGHTRIAFIKGALSHPDGVERFGGYRAALKDHGIAYDPKLVVLGDFQESGGRQAALRLLRAGTRFTAIFAANDQMAVGAALALHEEGLRVPDDVSLVGFDDLSGSPYTLPPLTTVKHSIYEIGKLAAEAMIKLINGETPQPKVPPPQLVVRGSTVRAAAGVVPAAPAVPAARLLKTR